jgi:hypothetical protein
MRIVYVNGISADVLKARLQTRGMEEYKITMETCELCYPSFFGPQLIILFSFGRRGTLGHLRYWRLSWPAA